MIDYMMKLNKVHFYNLGCISDMVKEIFPDICLPINIMNKMVDMFNNYNAYLCPKAIVLLMTLKLTMNKDGNYTC